MVPVQWALVREALRRRWWLVVVGLLATAALCTAATRVVPADHEATARLLLLPPASSLERGGNPYLALSGLSTTAAIVSKAVSDDATLTALRAEGARGDYIVEPDLSISGPVLLLTVQARSDADAIRTLELLSARVPVTLVDLQRSLAAPRSAYITTSVLTADTRSRTLRKSQTRAVVLAFVLGCGGTVVATALLDNLVARLRRRGGSGPDRPEARDERSDDLPAGRRHSPVAVVPGPRASGAHRRPTGLGEDPLRRAADGDAGR